MSTSLTLKAQNRDLVGKKVKKLRRQGIIPAVIFGKGLQSKNISISASDFLKVFKLAGETNLINLTLPDSPKPHHVIVSQTTSDPLTDSIAHVDFRQVLLTEKIKAHVPFELVGESSAVKEKNGVITLVVHEVEVEAFPTDLPHSITIDLSVITDIDQSILLKDIAFDRSKVTLDLSPETTIVTCQAQKVEVEPTPPETPLVAPDATTQEANPPPPPSAPTK